MFYKIIDAFIFNTIIPLNFKFCCGMPSCSSGLGFFLSLYFCLVVSAAFSCKKCCIYFFCIDKGQLINAAEYLCVFDYMLREYALKQLETAAQDIFFSL
jgi:hypothetical protein